MSFLGTWKIDDLLTFPAITHRTDTGALTDADSVPSYRVYEDETGTAILTGSMAKLDDANTTGFYSEQITLSAANGFEAGKCYTIYITAAVNSVTGGQHHTFKVEAAPATASALATVDSNVSAIKANTDNLPADPADQSELASLIAGIAGGGMTLEDLVEGALTVQDALRLLLATSVGKSSRNAQGQRVYRDTADTRNRVVATVSNGDRSDVTLDLS